MQDDIDRLGGIRYNPGGLTAADRELADYFRWASALPGSAWGGAPLPVTPLPPGERGNREGEPDKEHPGDFLCNNGRPHEVHPS
jgi:hypothetical protein